MAAHPVAHSLASCGLAARRAVVRAVAALGVATLVATFWWVPSAGAHGDEGLLRVVGIQQASEEDQVRVTVDYAYDDEHAVYRDGALRLSGASSEGVALIPLTFSRSEVDGRYAVDVVLPPPGTWTLRVDGTSPVATTEVSYDTAAPEWLEPGAVTAAAESEHSGLHVRWDWMLAGFAAVAGWFLFLRWRRRAVRGALSNPG